MRISPDAADRPLSLVFAPSQRGFVVERGGFADLTLRGQFDSYRTMYVGRGSRGKLAPGQFERIAKALSDPRRFALLETIGGELECPNERLCRDFPVSKATISHHLRELVQAGLVESEREGQFLQCRVRRDVLKAYAAELVQRVARKPAAMS